MNVLYVLAAINVVIIVLCLGDILLRTLVSDETIDRWAETIFGR